MKAMTGTGKARKRPWSLRFAACVMSCFSCTFLPYAVHAQVDCMGATMQLQGYAQQVQEAAANQYSYLQGQLQGQLQLRCSGCGYYDMYCQQACQSQITPYFAPYFGNLNQWYYYQMQQIGNWYNMINVKCAQGSAAPTLQPGVVADGRNETYVSNLELERRIEALRDEVARTEPDFEVEIKIPRKSLEIISPDNPTGFGSN